MTEESTIASNGAEAASHKTGAKKGAAKKKSGSKKATPKAGATVKAKAKAKAKKTPTGGKRRGKNPEVANKIRAMKAQNPEVTAEEIAKKLGCSVNYVYLKWGAPKRAKSKRAAAKKGGAKKTTARKNGGGAETEFRHALRLVGLERARQLLDAFEREE